MNIAVAGLWHLGCVTAACLAKAGYRVLAYDPDPAVINLLKKNTVPVFEPELDNLISDTQKKGKLIFSSDPQSIANAEIIWITFDTPVNQNDEADPTSVIRQIAAIFPMIKPNAFMLISSQLPVGSTRKLAQTCHALYPEKKIRFAYSPENLRLGNAVHLFAHQDRIILGLENAADKNIFENLLKNFSENIITISLESAEMAKHALNAFLAISVVFANELAVLCEKTGANAREVELSLKSEPRIGKKAYLHPGHAIAGGTLLRDINYLTKLSIDHQQKTPLLSSVLFSNHAHQQWHCHHLNKIFPILKNKKIALLGLTYKPHTNTLRRSLSIVLAQWLYEQGAHVSAYDPKVSELEDNLSEMITLKTGWIEAIYQAEAVVVMAEHPVFKEITAEAFIKNMQLINKKAHVIDASSFLVRQLAHDLSIRYFAVGGC